LLASCGRAGVGGGADLAWDGRVVAGRWRLSGSGQEHLAIVACGGCCGSSGARRPDRIPGNRWWSQSLDLDVWSWLVGGDRIPSSLDQPPPPAVEPCPPGGHQVDLVALSGGAAPDSWHQGGVCWVRFSGWGARPFRVTVLSTPWWGGRRVPRMSDGHPLPGVELRVMSPASMEEGGKALSKALATESHGTLWLWWSA
jgi:hypothetical protein